MHKIINEDLSPQLQDIAKEIGLEATLLLATAKGGQVIWFGKNPSAELVVLLGAENAQKICAMYQGESIELNTLVRAERNAIAREVRNAYHHTPNVAKICRTLGLPRSKVRHMIKG